MLSVGFILVALCSFSMVVRSADTFGCTTELVYPTTMQEQALQKFYISTKGPTQWPEAYRGNWESKFPCAWDGNERAHPAPVGSRCVVNGWYPLPPRGIGGLQYLIHLSGMAEGPVPEEFKSLQVIQAIVLTGNKISGSIWDTSTHCFLFNLDLSHNQMSGSLPTNFMAHNINGENINLAYNNFEGTIPGETLSNLQYLTALVLNDNKFSGVVPDLSKAVELRELNLGNNQLSGSLGSWIKDMPNLAWLDVSNNNLEGSLPPALPPKLSRFSASGNKFSGAIPEAYAQQAFLRHFNCTGCSLQCSKPDLLAHLPFSTHCKPPTSRKWVQ